MRFLEWSPLLTTTSMNSLVLIGMEINLKFWGFGDRVTNIWSFWPAETEEQILKVKSKTIPRRINSVATIFRETSWSGWFCPRNHIDELSSEVLTFCQKERSRWLKKSFVVNTKCGWNCEWVAEGPRWILKGAFEDHYSQRCYRNTDNLKSLVSWVFYDPMLRLSNHQVKYHWNVTTIIRNAMRFETKLKVSVIVAIIVGKLSLLARTLLYFYQNCKFS